MESIFNLDALKSEMDQEKWIKLDDWMEDRRVYLGTVFNLTPSGKYYTPYANSNVAGDCDICNGTGLLSHHKRRRVVKRAYVRFNELSVKGHKRGRDYAISHASLRLKAKHIGRSECSHCGGLGSRSAHLDEIWYEHAEAELNRLGYSLGSGEGDPCDLYAIECRDIELEEVGT